MNCEALSATGTILSAIAALGIALFSYLQSGKRDRKAHEKEAIEKIIVPIRKELDGFSASKWDNWYFKNRWHQLKDMRIEFPLQYFWLSKNIKKSLEDFDQQFNQMAHLSQQMGPALTRQVADTFRKFISEEGISHETTGDATLGEENIIHAHWSCVIGGKFGPSVTLYSLVMWGKSLSEYLENRKKDPDLPNARVTDLKFSMHHTGGSIKIVLNEEQSEKLLSKIEEEVKKNKELEEYRKKWQELYHNGSLLIGKIDLWLSSE